VYRSSPPLVRSVSLACKHVDADFLCLLPCRSLACCKPANRSLRDFPSCIRATFNALAAPPKGCHCPPRSCFHRATTIRKHCVSSAIIAIRIASDCARREVFRGRIAHFRHSTPQNMHIALS
jgi:hypothetical protein